MKKEKIIEKLKRYFEKNSGVELAFLFGSQARGRTHAGSDWDIGVYFKPKEYGELETKLNYKDEEKIWREVENIIGENIDFVVLNRARPQLVYTVLNSGEPLVIKNRRLYLNLLTKTHYEALDWQKFTRDFFEIRERSKSLSEEDKAFLKEHIIFLENELNDIDKFKNMTQKDYVEDRDKKRNVERWVENIIIASIDIAKTIISSEKKDMPQTYRETLFKFALLHTNEREAENFSDFANLRNILAHEYLDIRWKKISNFIKEAPKLYPQFIAKAKQFI